MEEERKEFERGRRAATAGGASWKSALGTVVAPTVVSAKKKRTQPMTPAQRQQQMKGLSKAFVKNTNTTNTSGNHNSGWAKIDPVYVENDSDDEDDNSSSDAADGEDEVGDANHHYHAGRQQQQQQQQPDHGDENEGSHEENLQVDLMARMRANTKRLQQQKQQQQQHKAAPETTSSATTSGSSIKPTAAAAESSSAKSLSSAPISSTLPTKQNPNHQDNDITDNTDHTDDQNIKVQALHNVLQIADRHGLEAAWEWARDQVVESGIPNVWKEIPSSNPATATAKSPLAASRRMLAVSMLPRPINFLNNNNNTNNTKAAAAAVEQERKYHTHFKEAAKYTPFEFSSQFLEDVVVFVIRRPYGLEELSSSSSSSSSSSAKYTGLFEMISPIPKDQYARKAHVSTLATLEVAVLLQNRPIFLLLGDQQVRYRPSNTTTTTTTFETIMEWDDPTTTTTTSAVSSSLIIGAQFKQLVPQALLIRQHYASTLTSTAMAFQRRPPNLVVKEIRVAAGSTRKKEESSHDVGVDTSDLEVVSSSSSKTTTTTTTGSMISQSLQHFTWWMRHHVLVVIPRMMMIPTKQHHDPKKLKKKKKKTVVLFAAIPALVLAAAAAATAGIQLWSKHDNSNSNGNSNRNSNNNNIIGSIRNMINPPPS